MTEADISERIVKWIWYTDRGSPDEHDFGDGLPRQYGLSSVERTYFNEGRKDWMTTQERIDEMQSSQYNKEDFDLVERPFLSFTKSEQLAIWHYRWTPLNRLPHPYDELTQRFRAKVAQV